MARFLIPAILLLISVPSVAAEFRVTSPVLKENGRIDSQQVYSGFGCTGANISPELHWEGAPAETKSFAVTVFDPDAPGSGWWHWLIFDIPASEHQLAADSGNLKSGPAPKLGVQSPTDFGQPGYGGPCPPAGDKPHRYFFSVYALRVEHLPVKPDSPGAVVALSLNQNALKKAQIVSVYGR